MREFPPQFSTEQQEAMIFADRKLREANRIESERGLGMLRAVRIALGRTSAYSAESMYLVDEAMGALVAAHVEWEDFKRFGDGASVATDVAFANIVAANNLDTIESSVSSGSRDERVAEPVAIAASKPVDATRPESTPGSISMAKGTGATHQDSGETQRRTVVVPGGWEDTHEGRAALLGGIAMTYGGRNWQVEQVSAVRPERVSPDGTRTPASRSVVVVRGRANPRPGRDTLKVEGSGRAAELRAAGQVAESGLCVVAFDAVRGEATVADVPEWVRGLRGKIAKACGKDHPWDIEVEATWLVEKPGQPARVDTVVIHRSPKVQGDLNKQSEFWLANVVPVIPGAGDGAGWTVDIDLPTGRVTLRYGVPTTLPTTAPFAWSVIDNGTWGDIAVGEDGDGRPVVLDLSANPHTLVVGKTGSGKSIFLEAIIYNALVHGWELAIVDPTKRGLDFRWARPYVRTGGWGCQSYTAALEVMRGVYEEGKRRLDLLDSLDIPKWTELSESQRSEHNIVPVLVVLDEATSFAKLEPVLRALAADDPERVEAEEINADKQRGMALISKIARECRYVGIHLVVGTQRFSVQDIGDGAGGLRENLGNRVLLGRASQTAVSMALAEPADAVSAYTQAHGVAASSAEPDSKERRPGRGIAEMDGMPTTAFQGWYASHDELVKELLARGIKRSDPPAQNLTLAPSAEEPDDASVIDLGDITFSLDDLEAADEATERARPSLDELWPDDD